MSSIIFGLGVSTVPSVRTVLIQPRDGAHTDLDAVLPLPYQCLHHLAVVAIVVGRKVRNVVCDGSLLVRQGLFGQIGGLSEGHDRSIEVYLGNTIEE